MQELNTIEIEEKLLKLLNSKSIPHCPKIILQSNNYYLYEFIKGDLLYNNFKELNKDQKKNICYKIARFHHELEKVTKNEALGLGIGEYVESISKFNPSNFNLSKLDHKDRDNIQCIYKAYTESLYNRKAQLSHNDAHVKNIIQHNGTLNFIDFGDALIRDIHYDFYRYVLDFPHHWEIIVDYYETLSQSKLSRQKIISASFFRHLNGFCIDLSKEDFKEKINYYINLLRKDQDTIK